FSPACTRGGRARRRPRRQSPPASRRCLRCSSRRAGAGSPACRRRLPASLPRRRRSRSCSCPGCAPMSLSQLFDLSEKPGAIIGGGPGIGEAVGIGGAQLGATVAVLDANEEAARRVAAGIGTRASAGSLDIRDAAAVTSQLESIAHARNGLDIVVCTPSINVRKPILQYEEDEFDRVVDL